MRIDIQRHEDCCGCTACASSCVHNAITMVPDEYGFYYPHVDKDKCVDCGLCVNNCQFNKNYKRYSNFEVPLVFGGRQKSKEEIKKSQTGGLCALIYKEFLLRTCGVIYGVTFDADSRVIFQCVDNIDDAQRFRGSKYVQADIDGVYKQVWSQLVDGYKVLFIGTPCQVAGLKSYLPTRLHENLLTVDLVCHSNTAPKIWKSYVRYLQNKYESKIVKADFRNKRFGWHQCYETYTFENNYEEVLRSYDHLFFKHLNIRPSCTNCPYTNFNRVSDITIGDYWGWEKNHSEWNDNLGINLILVNSERGRIFFESIKNELEYKQTDISDCLQPQLQEPISKNPKQDKFLFDYRTKGMKYVLYKYGDLNYIFRLKAFFHRLKIKITH